MVVRAPASRRSPERAEERLLVEAAQKDPARFAELYEINFERVYAFIARRVGDRDAAEDLTSEVFHKALANLRRFEWRGVPFAAWLLRIAGNAIADRAQRAGRELAVDDPPELGADASALVDLEEVEHRARLFRLVDDLPADQRRVIAMRFEEEKSIREIAEELGRTEGAVKQLQFRGLQNLRAKIKGGEPRFDSAPGGLRTRRNTKKSKKPGGEDA
jgi:RNA polymerase sigma-70 factor (ECF subfamily)